MPFNFSRKRRITKKLSVGMFKFKEYKKQDYRILQQFIYNFGKHNYLTGFLTTCYSTISMKPNHGIFTSRNANDAKDAMRKCFNLLSCKFHAARSNKKMSEQKPVISFSFSLFLCFLKNSLNWTDLGFIIFGSIDRIYLNPL